MATRNERRRRARQQAIARNERERARGASHGERMMAKLVKAAETRQPQSKQSDTWDPEKTIPPPLPPDALWTIYEQNSFHSGCINAKVTDSVGRGWKLTPEDDTEDGAEDDVDRLTRTLRDTLKQVCTALTFEQLCQQAVREMEAVGWGGWEILRDSPGDVESEITGILPVPAMSIRAVKGTDDVFCVKRAEKKSYFKRFGVKEHVNADDGTLGDEIPEEDRGNEIVLFKHYSPRSSWYGIPSWVSAMPAVAEFAAIREFNVSFFESGGQADRHIHVSATDADVATGLADQVVQQLEDARGMAHVSIVTSGDDTTKVTTTSLTPKQPTTGRDSEFRGGKEDLKEEIRVAHQVPPGRLGIAEGGAMAGNANDSMDDDYRYGVIDPLQDIIEAELERTVFGELGFGEMISGYSFEFEDRTRDEEEATHDRAMDGVDKAVLSPNDAREATGRDRIEDPAMDRYYMDGTPISTDPGVSEVTQLLSELRDALAVAVQTPPTVEPDTAPGEEEVETDEVAASEDGRLRRSGWAIFRRNP